MWRRDLRWCHRNGWMWLLYTRTLLCPQHLWCHTSSMSDGILLSCRHRLRLDSVSIRNFQYCNTVKQWDSVYTVYRYCLLLDVCFNVLNTYCCSWLDYLWLFLLSLIPVLLLSGGYYCDEYNATSVTAACDAGYYCTSAAQSATPSFEDLAGPCPAG